MSKPRKKAAAGKRGNPRQASKPNKMLPANKAVSQETEIYRRRYLGENQATRVSYDNALTFAAVWCCVRVIAETLAVLPWQVFRRLSGGGRERDEAHVVDYLLSKRPNPEMTPMAFKETLASHVVTWGNAYAEIERDGAGRPLWLHLITPDRVCVMRDLNGEIVYEVRNFTRETAYIKSANMLHVPGLGFDGMVGYSVIEMASRSIALGIDMESDASGYWANNSTPGGVLEHPNTMSENAHKLLQESWEKRHGGPKKRGRIAILEEGMKYHQIGLPNTDSQFLENRSFQLLEICRWYRVPPHKIFELGRATWANIESQEIDFVSSTIMPWATRFEQAADWKLFGRQQQGVYYTRFKSNAAMRGDSAARSEFYSKMRDLGVFSVNEIREFEDLNPIGEEGDKRLVQLNLTTLEKIGEEPPEPAQPAVEPAQPGAEPEQEDDEPAQDEPKSAQNINIWPLVSATAKRIVRREQNRIRDGLKGAKGRNEAYDKWFEKFEAEHREYAARELTAVMQAFGKGEATASEVVREHWANVQHHYTYKPEEAIDEASIVQNLESLIEAASETKLRKETAA
jgi:HK97 family phage portal protein